MSSIAPVSKNRTTKARSQHGSSLLELPAGLWITLIVFLVPMVALASITIRVSLLNIATQEAVHAAAKARTYEQASDEGPSAVQLAQKAFDKVTSSFPGLGANKVSLRILATDVKSGTITTYESKLKEPANSSAYLYQVESKCTGSIEPVFGISQQLFGDVPGLTTPMPVNSSAREMVENPQGLDR